MRVSYILSICVTLAVGLAGCSGEQSVEKTLVGTWVQDTPTSMTSAGLQTTTSDTVLKLNKNGEVLLTRNLDIAGQGLPEGGVEISLELRGTWAVTKGQLHQSQESALIMPRTTDATSLEFAEELQTQADKNEQVVKDIISVNRKELILQDTDTGTTDIYRRK